MLEPAVPDQLMGLVRKELIRPDRRPDSGGDAYRFRHLLDPRCRVREPAEAGTGRAPRAVRRLAGANGGRPTRRPRRDHRLPPRSGADLPAGPRAGRRPDAGTRTASRAPPRFGGATGGRARGEQVVACACCLRPRPCSSRIRLRASRLCCCSSTLASIGTSSRTRSWAEQAVAVAATLGDLPRRQSMPCGSGRSGGTWTRRSY